MKRSELDWPYLRRGMLPLVLACAITLALVGASFAFKSNSAALLEERQAVLADLQLRGNQTRGKLDALTRFRAAYADLEQTGVIGPEQRLVWVKYFTDAAKELKLPYLRYTADQQAPFSAAWLRGDTARVMASRLRLQIGLIHSLDLLRAIERIRAAPGFFHVTGCELERVVKDGSIYANKPNVLANCDVHWFSIPTPAGAIAS